MAWMRLNCSVPPLCLQIVADMASTKRTLSDFMKAVVERFDKIDEKLQERTDTNKRARTEEHHPDN